MSANTPNRIIIPVLQKTLYGTISIVFLIYLSVPNPSFPLSPNDALQSNEPGDTESTLRRAYFTNETREEVLTHYESQFRGSFVGLTIPQYRLNYPPEEAQIIIRDQTRSTFLEEIVHPFRESVYINGFEPKEEKDKIVIENRPWRQKIIVRYVPSNVFSRVIIGLFIITLLYLIINAWFNTLKYLKRG